MLRLAWIVVFLSTCAASEEGANAVGMRRRLELAAARAVASFHSADSISSNLHAGGVLLHANLVVLRHGIESNLDRAELALKDNNALSAKRALNRAEALIERYSRKLGGS